MGIIKKIFNVDSTIWVWKIQESTDELAFLKNQKTNVKSEIKKKRVLCLESFN